jgi:hypothetical protein
MNQITSLGDRCLHAAQREEVRCTIGLECWPLECRLLAQSRPTQIGTETSAIHPNQTSHGLSAGFEVPLSTAGRERLNRADDSFRVRWI